MNSGLLMLRSASENAEVANLRMLVSFSITSTRRCTAVIDVGSVRISCLTETLRNKLEQYDRGGVSTPRLCVYFHVKD